MARPATIGELILLRGDGQKSTIGLAIHAPSSVYTARVNGTPASLDSLVEITYDGGSGTLGDVLPGMTLWIGSSAGAYDKGMVRIRKAPTASIFYVSEGSDVNVANDDYLTVVNEFGIWPKHMFVEVETTLMDWDIPYSNQHFAPNPVPVMGPIAAVKELPGVNVTHAMDASGSWVPGSTISSYSWVATGPASVGVSGGSTATPTFTFTLAGWYRIACTVTAANAKTTTGYRWVHVYDSSNDLVRDFTLDDCRGDFESGGWSFKVTMYAEANISDVRDRAMVMLAAKDWYGATQQSIGPVAGYENVVAVGWIDGESITWNPNVGTVEFTVQGPQFWIGQITGFPAGVKNIDGADPTDWLHFRDLTVDKGLFHFLYWRTTAANVIDIYVTGDTRALSATPAPMTSLWEQLNAIAYQSIFAKPLCDRYGRLFIEIDSQYLPVANRSGIPVVQTLITSDWREQVDIERRTRSVVSMLDISGISYDGATATPLFSRAPGRVFKRYGKPDARDHLLFADQAGANATAGLILGNLNNKYPFIGIGLASNHRLIDIAPLQYLQMSIASGDTLRGITLTDTKIVPRVVSISRNPSTGAMLTDIECEAETTPELSITILKPDPPTVGIPTPPPIGVPTWPIVPPVGPIFPPSPWNPPDPPPTAGDCATDVDAPQNGPFKLWFDYAGSILTSEGSQGWAGQSFAYFPCIIRSDAHTHDTYILIDGYFEQSDDEGATWELWPDMEGMHIYARPSAVIEIEADNSIFDGTVKDQRGGFLSPGASSIVNGNFELYLEPGPEIQVGPGLLDIVEVSSGESIIDYRTWQFSTADGDPSHAYAVYEINYPGLTALGSGKFVFTVQILQGSTEVTVNMCGYSGHSFTPTALLEFEQHFPPDFNPVEHNSNSFTPSGDTYYLGFAPCSGWGGGTETITLRVNKIQWQRGSDGQFFDLWEPGLIRRIRRIRMNDGFIYNICTIPEEE